MLTFLKNIGPTEVIIIAVVLLILFGSKKIRELSHGLGVSTKEMKKVKEEIKTLPETLSSQSKSSKSQTSPS